MSIQITRKCCVCQEENPNEIFVNWTEEALADEDFIHEFYNEWMCVICKHEWNEFIEQQTKL